MKSNHREKQMEGETCAPAGGEGSNQASAGRNTRWGRKAEAAARR